MATTEGNALDIAKLQSDLALLLSKSILPSAMTQTQRETLLDNIHPRILNNGVKYRTDKRGNSDYTAFQVGDFINHVDDVNKVHYSGIVLNATLTLPADFNDIAKFDKYAKDKPAIS